MKALPVLAVEIPVATFPCAFFARRYEAIIPEIMTPNRSLHSARSTTIGCGRIPAEKWSVSPVKEI